MNKVIITGRLTREIETQGTTVTGEEYAFINIANNDVKNKTVFVSGVISGERLNFVRKYIKPKGRVIIEGSLYDYKKADAKYGELRVNINRVEPIDWADKDAAAGSTPAPETEAGATNEPF